MSDMETLEDITARLVRLSDRLLTGLENEENFTKTHTEIYEKIAKVTTVLIDRLENKKPANPFAATSTEDLQKEFDE